LEALLGQSAFYGLSLTKSPKLFPGPQIRPNRHRHGLLEAFCLIVGFSFSEVLDLLKLLFQQYHYY
jgi:hypothetical protein